MATGTLTGQTIANTYKALLKITGTDAGGTTLAADAVIVIEDGDGNPSSLSLSQQRATITLGSGAGDDFIVDGTTFVVEGDNNRVGIGTASPTVELDVRASSGDSIIRVVGVEGNHAALELWGDDGDDATDGFQILGGANADGLYFRTSKTAGLAGSYAWDTRMIIKADGSVGIGTTIPHNKLTIANTAGANAPTTVVAANTYLHLGQGEYGASNNGKFMIGFGYVDYTGDDNTHSPAYIGYEETSTTGDTKGDLTFYTRNAATDSAPIQRMIINDDGNVGIGTASPEDLLHIQGVTSSVSDTQLVLEGRYGGYGAGINFVSRTSSGGTNVSMAKITADGEAAFDTTAANQDAGLRFFTTLNGTSAEKMRITADGAVGIGDTSPDGHLDVEDLTITTAVSYSGIRASHIVTDGAHDAGDTLFGIVSSMAHNDADKLSGPIYGAYLEAQAVNSTGESSNIFGCQVDAVLIAGDHDYMTGVGSKLDIDGGTIDGDALGYNGEVDIDGGTLSGSVYGSKIDINTTQTPAGVNFGQYIIMQGGGMHASTDMFFYCYDGTNSDTVAQITALAGVATFDSGDFSGAPDYAEYFESKDGNAIAVGKTVKLDGDKVVACSEGDTPIGVVRPDGVGTSAYKAGAQNLKWHGKYIHDNFNELQMEDYTQIVWTEAITFDEYIARGKDETGGSMGGHVKDKKIEGSKAIPAKDAVTQQKTVDEEVEEEVTTTSLVDGKYVQKTETVTKTVKVPQYNEVDLYDKDGEVIGKHQVPIMETVTEAVAGVDAVPDTYSRKHKYHSDRLPEGVTAPDDAETVTPNHQRKKLNPDFDASKVDDYIARPERDEWNLIGLLGQIPITKGQPLADNWTKMKDVSDTVEMYFVK